ncbi:MAG: hypothetical protein WA634_12005 [Silvibacterium sp.]
MTTEAANPEARHGNILAWIGAANLIVLAAWIPILIFARNSAIVMASAGALTICFCLAWTAFRGDYIEKWTPSMAWRVRIGAAILGVWLFISTPTLAGRFAAVAIYAALYVLCERAIWRRKRAAS